MAESTDTDEFVRSVAAVCRAMTDALPAIVLQGAEIVMSEIEPRMHVASGDMRGALAVSSGAQQLGFASATVAVQNSDGSGKEHYAIYQEFGTSDMPANPFFRPGIVAARGQVADFIEQEISKVLNT
jgi:HK97 gp10 family phage protein